MYLAIKLLQQADVSDRVFLNYLKGCPLKESVIIIIFLVGRLFFFSFSLSIFSPSFMGKLPLQQKGLS